MDMLIIGLAIFILIHLVPCVASVRNGIVAKLGDGPYKAIFSIISIIALALIVMGLRSAETIPMYDPPSWGRTANYVVMFFAIYLFFSNSLGADAYRSVCAAPAIGEHTEEIIEWLESGQ